jgi:hypothetical protein
MLGMKVSAPSITITPPTPIQPSAVAHEFAVPKLGKDTDCIDLTDPDTPPPIRSLKRQRTENENSFALSPVAWGTTPKKN